MRTHIMNHTHDFTINVLLVQLAFQFVAFMLWLHLSGLDGLRRERMIQLLEQRPIHITRVFREEDSDSEDSDEDSDSEDDEDFDNDDEVSDDEKDEDSDDEDFDHEDGEDDEDDEEDDEDNRSEATVEGDTPAPDAATEDDRTDLGEKKDQ